MNFDDLRRKLKPRPEVKPKDGVPEMRAYKTTYRAPNPKELKAHAGPEYTFIGMLYIKEEGGVTSPVRP